MVAALDQGADDYVIKPFGMEVLMARVRVALRHAAALAASVEETGWSSATVVDVPAHLATPPARRSSCRRASSACSPRWCATRAGW